MAELVDALASGASVRMGVEVRVLFWAPMIFLIILLFPVFLLLFTALCHVPRCVNFVCLVIVSYFSVKVRITAQNGRVLWQQLNH